MRRLADTSHSAAFKIRDSVNHISSDIGNIFEKINSSAASIANYINSATDAVNDTMTRLGHIMDGANEKMELIGQDTENLAKDIGNVIFSLQFQDITRQKMEHVIGPLKQFNERLSTLFNEVKDMKDRISMGDDGAKGMKELKDAGGYTIAQDEKSCIVFGMPKEAIKLGGVDRILPLSKIADEIIRRVSVS